MSVALSSNHRSDESLLDAPMLPSSPGDGDIETRPSPAGLPRLQCLRRLLSSWAKTAATVAATALAILAFAIIWSAYVATPWTRDGRIRVQVASVAPQVSGQVTELRVVDNQYVRKGDVLYVIDSFDFRVALDQAKQELAMKAADAEVKRQQADRRKSLTNLSTTPEEQQRYAGDAVQAQTAVELARLQVAQAEVNLERTNVRSPVNGFVTNLLMRAGDYAHAGTANISVIDANSYWIDGYFEETKLASICVGDMAEAQLMGYRQPIIGRVRAVTRGISVSDATPGTQGLPNVDPIYTWVRLAQRIPVRIEITNVPPNVPLVSGLTATVTIRDAETREGGNWFFRPLHALADRIGNAIYGPPSRPSCTLSPQSRSDRQ